MGYVCIEPLPVSHFETGPYYVEHIAFKLTILLPQLFKCWNHRHNLRTPALTVDFLYATQNFT